MITQFAQSVQFAEIMCENKLNPVDGFLFTRLSFRETEIESTAIQTGT